MAVMIRLNRRKGQNHSSAEVSLDEQALGYLRKNGATGVAALFDALRVRNPSLTASTMTNLVWRLAEEDKVDLRDLPPPAKSLVQYLRFWERNLWFYTAVGVSLLTILAVYVLPEQFPLVALRWVLGSVFVLFIPGYVTVEALFPKSRELDGIERFALSVGLSLALVPLIGLLLNYTPWGIRLTPIVISLSSFTVAIALIALARQYRVSVETAQLYTTAQQ